MVAPGEALPLYCGFLPPVVMPDGHGGHDSVRPSVHRSDCCSKWEEVA